MLLQLEICNEFGRAPPIPPLGGIEPPAFRLTAERASQLRHRGTSSVLGEDATNWQASKCVYS